MSEFENGCSGNCGDCGSDCSAEGQATVTLTLDDGTVMECAILTIYPAGEKYYIALLPLDENGEADSSDVYLYRYEEEDGNPSLSNIEDDDEYEIAADAFDEFLDRMEFEEMEDESDAQ